MQCPHASHNTLAQLLAFTFMNYNYFFRMHFMKIFNFEIIQKNSAERAKKTRLK